MPQTPVSKYASRAAALIGEKSGDLTVRSKCNERHQTTGERLFLCDCKCGREAKVLGSSIRQKTRRSCGKCGHVIVKVGDTSGRLTVIGIAGNVLECECSCNAGKTVTVNKYSFANGATRSCGCLKREQLKLLQDASKKNLAGITSGRLTCIAESTEEGADGCLKLKCTCKCDGREVLVTRSSFLSEGTRSCGCLKREQGRRNALACHKKTRQKYKDARKVKIEGRWLLSQIAACEFLDVHKDTVRYWCDKGIPWMNGGRLVRIHLPKPFIQRKPYFFQDELQKILDAKEAAEEIRKITGLVHVEEGAKERGISRTALKLRVYRAGYKSTPQSGKRKDGRMGRRAYITREILDAVCPWPSTNPAAPTSQASGKKPATGAPPQAEPTSQLETTQESESFSQLKDYAAKKMKGKQQRIVLLACSGSGSVPLADLATEFQWGTAARDENFHSAQTQINKKLRKAALPWILIRNNNKATLAFHERK
jgi:hypothetical protein